MKARISKFFDECKLAAIGIVLATRYPSFVLTFLITFLVFGTLISLLSAGSSAIDLFFASDFGGKMQILGDGVLAFFGRGRNFSDFLLNFLLAFFQATLIGLIVFVIRMRKQNGLGRRPKNTASRKPSKHNDNKKAKEGARADARSTSIENASIATGLAILGSGCPTCGTTLITPILTSVFSSGSIAIAGAISGIMTTIAYLLIFWSLKKMGLEAYVIIKDEQWRKKRQKMEENE